MRSERRSYQLILESGIEVNGVRAGNKNGEKCIILGPEIYLECVPEQLKEQLEFITAPMYWNINTNAPLNYIDNLAIPSILTDLHEVQQKLNIDKIFVLGPSALGLLAIEYGRFYPNETLGTISLGAPLDVKKFLNAPKKSYNFFEENYKLRGGHTKKANETWKLFKEADRAHQAYQENRKTDENVHLDERQFQTQAMQDYQEELAWLSPRIYWNPQKDADNMAKLWRMLNMRARDRFFQILPNYDFSKMKNTETASINLIGLGDGLAYFKLTTDYIKNENPKHIEYYILPESRHNPLLDQPKEASDILMEWINEQSRDEKVYLQAKL